MTDGNKQDEKSTVDSERRTLLKTATFVGNPVVVPALVRSSSDRQLELGLGQSSVEDVELTNAAVDRTGFWSVPESNVSGSEPVIDTNQTRESGTALVESNVELRHAGLAATIGVPVFEGTFTPESSGRYRITATQSASGESQQLRRGEGKIAAFNAIRPNLYVREKQSRGEPLNAESTAPIKHAALRALAKEEIIEVILGLLASPLGVDLLEEVASEIGADVLSKPFEEQNKFSDEIEINEFDAKTSFPATAGKEYIIENHIEVLNLVFSIPEVLQPKEFVVEVGNYLMGRQGDLTQAVDTELDLISNNFEVEWDFRLTYEKIDEDAPRSDVGLGPVDDAVFEIVSAEEAELYYAFAVKGNVERAKVSEKVKAESSNDAVIIGNDEDIVTVRGFTGTPGYGDAYRIDGEILWFQQAGRDSDYILTLEDSGIIPSEIGQPPGGDFKFDSPDGLDYVEGNSIEGVVEIVATDTAELHYTLIVRGDVERAKVSEKVKAESSNDAVIIGNDEDIVTVRGFTGTPGYGDAYRVDGEILALNRVSGASDFFIRFNGERLTVDELLRGEVS